MTSRDMIFEWSIMRATVMNFDHSLMKNIFSKLAVKLLISHILLRILSKVLGSLYHFDPSVNQSPVFTIDKSFLVYGQEHKNR